MWWWKIATEKKKKTAVSVFRVSTVANRMCFSLLSRADQLKCMCFCWSSTTILHLETGAHSQIVIHDPHSGPKTENCRWYSPFDLARVHQIEMILLIFRTCNRTLFNVTPPLYRHIVMVVVRSRYLSVTRKQGLTFISKTFSVTVFPFSVIVFPDLCISKVKHLFNIMYITACPLAAAIV